METRIDRAIHIYEGADHWLHAVDPEGNFQFYLVPATGAPTHFWRTTADSCNCPDAEYRGVTCKHQWAVRLYETASEERTVKEASAEARKAARAEARRAARAAAQPELPLETGELPRIEGGQRVA